MSKTVQVGDLHTHEDKKGFTYTQTYFVDSADEATYTPVYGQDGDAAPFTLPVNTFIYDWDKIPAADQFIITIKGHNDDYDNSDSSDWNSSDKSQRLFSLKDLYMDPVWWGVHRATEAEGGSREPDGTPTISPLLNLHNVAAHSNEWVFNNATSVSVGSANYNESPYTAASMATAAAKTWAGQTVKTIIYKVVFYTKNDIMAFMDWYGVNGLGAGNFSPPNGCVPTGFIAEGQWKALDCQCAEDVKPFNGIPYHSVTRTMELAPSTLRWDKAKTFGGLWTW